MVSWSAKKNGVHVEYTKVHSVLEGAVVIWPLRHDFFFWRVSQKITDASTHIQKEALGDQDYW